MHAESGSLALLSVVLPAKIALTALAWAGPLLLLPKRVLAAVGIPALETPPFGRLLGWAFAALLVVYASGLRDCWAGYFPWGTVLAGIVSNGGATLAILSWDRKPAPGWSRTGRGAMLASAAAAGAVCLGLLSALLLELR